MSALTAIDSYSTKNSLVLEIKTLLNRMIENHFTIVLCWIPSHVDIKGNEDADKAAKEAVSSPRIEKEIPLNDILSNIKITMRQKWQREWEDVPLNNKLRSIKQCINSWPSSTHKNRFHEVILTRLRIGHTNLTHSYLMTSPHDDPPICDLCHCLLSVKHFLINCPKYNRYRRIFKDQTLNSILAENQYFSFNNILYFLKQTNLLRKI